MVYRSVLYFFILAVESWLLIGSSVQVLISPFVSNSNFVVSLYSNLTSLFRQCIPSMLTHVQIHTAAAQVHTAALQIHTAALQIHTPSLQMCTLIVHTNEHGNSAIAFAGTSLCRPLRISTNTTFHCVDAVVVIQ